MPNYACFYKTFQQSHARLNLSLGHRWFRWNGAAVAGLLLAAAFPKINLAGAAWVAPAIFLLAAHGQNGRAAFRTGYIGGLVFWLASLYWLLLMPAPGFSILAWVALCAYLALFPAAWLAMVQAS